MKIKQLENHLNAALVGKNLVPDFIKEFIVNYLTENNIYDKRIGFCEEMGYMDITYHCEDESIFLMTVEYKAKPSNYKYKFKSISVKVNVRIYDIGKVNYISMPENITVEELIDFAKNYKFN